MTSSDARYPRWLVPRVLEAPDGRVVAVEVKATSSPRAEDLRSLRYLQERLGDRVAHGVLLCTTEQSHPVGKNLSILPVSALWTCPES